MALIDYRELRAEKGRRETTNAAIGDACGITGATVGKVLAGNCAINLRSLELIADVLGLEVVISFRPKEHEKPKEFSPFARAA